MRRPWDSEAIFGVSFLGSNAGTGTQASLNLAQHKVLALSTGPSIFDRKSNGSVDPSDEACRSPSYIGVGVCCCKQMSSAQSEPLCVDEFGWWMHGRTSTVLGFLYCAAQATGITNLVERNQDNSQRKIQCSSDYEKSAEANFQIRTYELSR
jgi:hypothetical protein